MEDYCSATSDTLVHPNKTIWLHTNKGNEYDNNVDCTMTLYTEPNHRLLAQSHAFSLEDSDCLSFYDSDGTNEEFRIYKACGNDFTGQIDTKRRYLTLNFKTNLRDKDKGATMSITSISEGMFSWQTKIKSVVASIKCQRFIKPF